MDRVTVAICTWNRARLLDQTLTQMHALKIPQGLDWELLVVNNNCTDDTDAVLARHARALPLRRILEPTQGKSHACNRAVAEARGDLMVWTDDDVLVDPEWLAAYRQAADRWPEASYFGGPIEPWFERTPPHWVLEHVNQLAGMLVVKDLGPDERVLSRAEFPFGANMALRTAVLRAHRFDPELGPAGTNQIRGEETVLLGALKSQGAQGLWVPRARVRHFVTAHRLTRDYLWTYHYGAGRSCARQEVLERIPRVGKTWTGVPRWVIRQAVESWVLAHWKQLRRRTDWAPEYARAAFGVGMIAEILHQMRVGRSV